MDKQIAAEAYDRAIKKFAAMTVAERCKFLADESVKRMERELKAGPRGCTE